MLVGLPPAENVVSEPPFVSLILNRSVVVDMTYAAALVVICGDDVGSEPVVVTLVL